MPPTFGTRICVKCQRAMKPEVNGIYAIEYIDKELTEAYRIWQVDLWACPVCHYHLISGFGDKPLNHNGEVDFEDRMKAIQATAESGLIFKFY